MTARIYPPAVGAPTYGGIPVITGDVPSKYPREQIIIVSETDPGAVGARKLWVSIPADPTDPIFFAIRNDDNDDWIDIHGAAVPTPSLQLVLLAGADAHGIAIINENSITAQNDQALSLTAGVADLNTDGGDATLTATDGPTHFGGNARLIGGAGAGGDGAQVIAQGATDLADGQVDIYTDGAHGTDGMALVSLNARAAWGGVTIAAGVPGAPPEGKLPFHFDSTAVTGGLYVWDTVGLVWVKVSVIP